MDVLVTDEVGASPDALWDRVRRFGEVDWMQGVTKVELEGEGVGMIRTIHAGGGPAILEKCTGLDDDARRLDYTITENNPLPVGRYDAHVQVVDLGDGRSRLEWGCACEPEGVDEASARKMIAGMYGLLVGWLKAAAEG